VKQKYVEKRGSVVDIFAVVESSRTGRQQAAYSERAAAERSGRADDDAAGPPASEDACLCGLQGAS